MRIDASPSAVVLAFVLGACTTVAVQSSAASEAPVEATSESAPTAADPAPAASVVPIEAARQATAPNGSATITHLARGQNAFIGQLRMDAGGAVPSHRDPTEEYIHVLSGAGVMTIDGQDYEVATGTTIYMPAGAEVSFQNGDAELVALQVFAGPEPAQKYEAWTPAE